MAADAGWRLNCFSAVIDPARLHSALAMMRTTRGFLALVLAGCPVALGGEPSGNDVAGPLALPPQGTRVWITSINPGPPLRLGTQARGYPPWSTNRAPEIPISVGREWKTNYTLFSNRLVSAAQKAQLDSGSLAEIFTRIRTTELNKGLAILPTSALSVEINGERAWVAILHWEGEELAASSPLSHFRYFVFEQRRRKLLDFQTCD